MKSAPARRASAINASISSLGGNTPWVFDAPARIRSVIASIAVSTSCEPPGASAHT